MWRHFRSEDDLRKWIDGDCWIRDIVVGGCDLAVVGCEIAVAVVVVAAGRNVGVVVVDIVVGVVDSGVVVVVGTGVWSGIGFRFRSPIKNFVYEISG